MVHVPLLVSILALLLVVTIGVRGLKAANGVPVRWAPALASNCDSREVPSLAHALNSRERTARRTRLCTVSNMRSMARASLLACGVVAMGCGNSGVSTSSGDDEGIRISGCLERTRAGTLLVLVTDAPVETPSGRLPERHRLPVASEPSADVAQHVGRRVTLIGTLREVDGVIDPGTQVPRAGPGADSSQTEERNLTGLEARRIGHVGPPCSSSE